MSLYRAVTVRLETPPQLFGNGPALVFNGNDRMVLERGDVSYASWVAMAAAMPQADVNILVRR